MSSEELKRYGPTSDGIIFGQQHRLIGEKTDGDFVRYEDYAALEAENGQIGRTLYERNNELCACELERSAARAQLAAIQGGMGEQWKDHMTTELVGKLTECASVYGKTQQLRERLRGIILPVIAQHQRITAAMAAEVERLKVEVERLHRVADQAWAKADQFGNEMFWSRWDQAKHGGFKAVLAERNALRAELAELKGREAVPVAWRVSVAGEWEIGTDREKVQFQRDLFERVMSDETEHEEAEPLYASPPASPDVDGLVKALEATLKLGRGTSGRIILESEDEGALRTALSTWRQAHTPSTLPASSAEE